MAENGPIFVISDLHLGDGGFRDNFARGIEGNREEQLSAFLDYVCRERGELIIIGDLFEFWQANLSKLLVKYRPVLDRFSEMRAAYVVGNHDVDLASFIGTGFLFHPFFGRMCHPFERVMAGKRFRFMHGHEVDPFNCGDSPGWGRVFSILAGMLEDRNESPIFSDGKTVEALLGEFGELMLQLWERWSAKAGKCGESSEGGSPKRQLTPAQNAERVEELYQEYRKHRDAAGYDIAIVGHTHRAGRLDNWYYNSGSWTDDRNNFLEISASGDVSVFDWTQDGPVPNRAVLDA